MPTVVRNGKSVEKVTRERLVALGPQIECTSDIGKSCKTDSVADDWYSILKVSEHLRVAADRSERARQGCNVVAAYAR